MIRLACHISLILILCAGCDSQQVVYDESREIPNARWNYGDQYQFEFEITDTVPRYRLFTDITHAQDYRWENFYCRIQTQYPGDSARLDVISFELANPVGDWLGSCNNQRCIHTIPLQARVKFDQTGTYRISFEQYMREETIEGIEKIGLRLVELEE